MRNVSNNRLAGKILVLFLAALWTATYAGAAINGCNAADIDADGVVGGADLVALQAAWGQADPRKDLDGNGAVGDEDLAILFSFWAQVCATVCPADLNSDGVVDATDRARLEAAYGTDCRADLDRDGTVDGDGTGSDDDTDVLLAYWGVMPAPASAEERADLDLDGVIGGGDLSILLAAIPTKCEADLNRDGAVNTNDLWALLGSWGMCQ